MTTKIACTHTKALHILADSGVLNEHNAQSLFNELCHDYKQPSIGYFYIDDVYNFAEDQCNLLIEFEDKQQRRNAALK